MNFTVRDLHGRALFHLEGDTARDNNGKPVAHREGSDPLVLKLAGEAAVLMGGRRERTEDERKVLLDLGINDVLTPPAEAEYGIPTGDFVGDRVCRVRFVNHAAGYFFLENIGDATNLVVTNADANGGTPQELNPGFTRTQFQTTGYALAAKISRLTVANADFDILRRTLRRLVEALKLASEVRVANLLTTAANWATANRVTLGATAKWNGGTAPNPLTDMFNSLKASALPANIIVMPEFAAQFFFQNSASAAMRDYVQSGGEMPKVVFARAKYTVAGAPAYVWQPTLPANVALVRASDDGDVIPTSENFRWLGTTDDGAMVEGMLVRTFYEPQSDSTWLVVAHNDAEVMVQNTVGALIVGALQ